MLKQQALIVSGVELENNLRLRLFVPTHLSDVGVGGHIEVGGQRSEPPLGIGMTLRGGVEIDNQLVEGGVAVLVAAELVSESTEPRLSVGLGVMPLENFFDDLLLKDVELVLIGGAEFGIEIDL